MNNASMGLLIMFDRNGDQNNTPYSIQLISSSFCFGDGHL